MLALLLWPCLLHAQVVQVPWLRALGLADGLPTQDVRAVAEDATGYLWVATGDGLLRFDGQRFRALHHEDGLPDPDLVDLYIDARDRLWLATRTQGVVMLEVDRTTFERADAAAPSAVRLGHVRQVVGTPDGRIWVIGDDGQVYWRSSAVPVWQRAALDDEVVTRVAVDRDGRLWAATARTLWRRGNDGFLQVPSPGDADAPWEALWADPHGGMEATAGGRSWLLDPYGRVLDGPRPSRTLLRDGDDARWRQSGQGLEWQQRGQVHAAGRGGGVSTRPPGRVRQVLQDRQGDLWWVGEEGGLWWLSAHWRRFSALPVIGDNPDADGMHPVIGLAASGTHHAWVAGAGGLLQRLDLRTGAVEHEATAVLARAGPTGMVEEDSGRLWLSGGGELVRYDPQHRQARRWPLGTSPAGTPSSLQICQGGQVWVAAGPVLHRLSPVGERLLSAPVAQWGLSATDRPRQLMCAHDDTLWATDPTGVLRWMPDRERFVRPEGETAGAATAMVETDDGRLWVARPAAVEQFRVRPDGVTRLQRIAEGQGYPQLSATALAIDAAGVLWAGATRGLVRVGPGPGEVDVLGVAQGLPAQEVLPQRLVRLRSGVIVAAVREGGLLAFDPTAMPLPPVVPMLVVDAMTRRRNDRVLPVPLGTGPVALRTTDRNIRVAVNLLGRGDPDRTHHRFRLLGQDPGWIETGPVAQRLFFRLPAGEHALLIQARHAGGPWSAVREVRLRVTPAWWETGAGRAALVVAGVMALAAGGRLLRARLQRRGRHRQMREDLALAELASEERTRFLSRLGRQVRTPMTPVLGWSELLLHSSLSPTQRTQVGSLHQAGHHLLQLVDDALDLASIEANRLQVASSAFELPALLDELHALLLPVAQAKALTLRWSTAIKPGRCHLGDVQRLRQVLLNLLGNALKFTARGHVALTAMPGEEGQGLVFDITDTGPGMSPQQVACLFERFSQVDGTWGRHGGSGLGLAISRDLVHAMGGGIEVHSQPGQGTRLRVRLPWRTAPAVQTTLPTAVQRRGADSLRVMVLLPSTSVTDVVCALLRAQGHRVVGVDDVCMWLSTVDAGPWDLIAADPDMLVAGERVSGRLPWLWPGVPRLALSPRADACAERDALSAGFDVFLRLPLTARRLEAALARCRVRA